MAKKTRHHKKVAHRHSYPSAAHHNEMLKWALLALLAVVVLVGLKKVFLYNRPDKWGKNYATPSQAMSENITVFTPTADEYITFPYTVTGKARTFESNVQLRVEDEAGTELYSTYTTADAPDVGQFGPFSIRLAGTELGLSNLSGKKVTIVLFESSAKDGAEINMVKIPVWVK